MIHRIVFFLAFILLNQAINAQEKIYDLETTALGRRTINRNDTTYTFYVLKPSKPIKTDINKRYYWFSNDTIMITAGSYDGWVLNGSYKVTYPDKNLRESGEFYNGLKDGEWKSWYPGGRIESIMYWKKGLQQGPTRRFAQDGKEERVIHGDEKGRVEKKGNP